MFHTFLAENEWSIDQTLVRTSTTRWSGYLIRELTEAAVRILVCHPAKTYCSESGPASKYIKSYITCFKNVWLKQVLGLFL